MSSVETMLDTVEAQVDAAHVERVEAGNFSGEQENVDVSDSADLVVTKVGQFTRQLHESLRELGFQDTVERAAL